MKKLMYLLILIAVGALIYYNLPGDDAATTDPVKEVSQCADDCQKACCLGCQATEGEAACLADHSCCAAHKAEAAEEADTTYEGHDHEGHDHEGHDHEGHDHEGHDHE